MTTQQDSVEGSAAHLSARELDVLRLYLTGLAAKQVATRLGVKETTVKEYLRRTRSRYAATGRPASTRMELYFRAVDDGLIPGRTAAEELAEEPVSADGRS